MSDLCNYCVNKDECETCDKGWHDHFVPSEDVRKYFRNGYVGVRGINGYIWHFDTTDSSLVPTHSVRIGNTHYCPYCGGEMYPVQDEETLIVTGHCCICEGARAELEYEGKKKALEEEYRKKLHSLQSEYGKVLSFRADRLLKIRQKHERNSFSYRPGVLNHFSTLNGEPYTDIMQF